jgi:hypothetical protein
MTTMDRALTIIEAWRNECPDAKTLSPVSTAILAHWIKGALEEVPK